MQRVYFRVVHYARSVNGSFNFPQIRTFRTLTPANWRLLYTYHLFILVFIHKKQVYGYKVFSCYELAATSLVLTNYIELVLVPAFG